MICILNASQRATNYFNAESCWKMNICITNEYTTLAPAQLLHKWREQWSSNKGDLDSDVTRETGRICGMVVDQLLISVIVP
jgi:hypothetical protein